jgi:hypothetical protein
MKIKFNSSFIVVCSFIVGAAIVRILFNELNFWNFSPVAAIALFAGAKIQDKRLAFVIPLCVLFLTDIVLGFYSYMLPVYGAFAITTLLGIMLSKKENFLTILIASVTSSAIFFLITNLVFWYPMGMYPMNLHGQMSSYIAALPFFRNTLLSDLLFNTALFGSWFLIGKTSIKIQEA